MADFTQRVVRKLNRMSRPAVQALFPPVRVGIIGCGKISSRHIAGYEDSGLAAVVGASDISLEALATALDGRSARGFTDHRTMIARTRPQIVSVCTWPQVRRKIVGDAARGGVKGILCEKPLALRMDDIDAMRAVCDENGVKLACGHQYRFNAAFCEAAALVERGAIGQVRTVTGRIRGSLANNGPHLVDTVRFVLGDPAAESVRSTFDKDDYTIERGLPCEKAATTEVRFAGGIDCTLHTGEADEDTFVIEVVGETGTIEVTPASFTRNGTLTRFDRKETAQQGRTRQFREFVEWVQGKRPGYCASAEQAAATAEIVLAGYESVGTGRAVELPLKSRGDVITPLFLGSGAAPAGTGPEPAGAAHPEFGTELACNGGRPAVTKWFESGPIVGLPELKNLAAVVWSGKMNRNGGRFVAQLEREFAGRYKSVAAVSSTSGTAALHVALATVNPEPGDEVITTPITDMGSVIPILQCNCVPVFADVDPRTGNMTAASIAARLTPRTRAVILVHLYGRPAELGPIKALCEQHGVALIEDCSQAHLAEYQGKMIGTIGDFGCFSFQQSKQISCGDGGITLVNRPADVERAQLYVDKGWVRRGDGRQHRFLGMNYRMTELQGAVALAQLARVEGLVQRRRAAAEELLQRLAELPNVVLPPADPDVVSSWWKFPLGWNESAGGSMDLAYGMLRCEGLKASRTYLPRPLFEEEMLRERITYGRSHFPYRDQDPQPCRADYPGLAEFDRRWINLPWSHRVDGRIVTQIARAVQKVAAALEEQPRSAGPARPSGATRPESVPELLQR